MKNQKTIIIGITVFLFVAMIAYYVQTGTVATTDYGITDAEINCDGDYYVFTGTFNTWRVGMHQVQVFCDDDASKNILNFYEMDVPSSGSYEWHVSRYIDDFDAEMPCDIVWFQLYDADASVVFFRTEDESIPECIPPIRTPTPPPTPTPTRTPTPPPTPPNDGDIWTIMVVVAFVLLIYFAFRKQPPITPRGKK